MSESSVSSYQFGFGGTGVPSYLKCSFSFEPGSGVSTSMSVLRACTVLVTTAFMFLSRDCLDQYTLSN